MSAGLADERGREARDRSFEVEDSCPEADPERDPTRLAARPAGREPAAGAADLLLEPALAEVVEVAVAGVGERGRVEALELEQRREQRTLLVGRDHAVLAEREDVREVGEAHAGREQVVVGELALVARGDELGRRPGVDPPGRAEVALRRLAHEPPPAPRAVAACRPRGPARAPQWFETALVGPF